MSTSLATSLLRRVLLSPASLRRPPTLLAASVPSLSARSYVVIPKAVKHSDKAAVSTKGGGVRSASSKVAAADENLKSVIDVEIEAVEQSEYYNKEFNIPSKFPFEITDTLGDQTITLKRVFNNETIKATVFSTLDEDLDEFDDEDEEESEEDEEEEEEGGKASLTVVVTVEKEGERGKVLEFVCGSSEDGFVIESMTVKKGDGKDSENAYTGPDFADLDEGLQDAVRRYLEVRGFRNSLFSFLNEYMMNKQEREYVSWLKNMKAYVAK